MSKLIKILILILLSFNLYAQEEGIPYLSFSLQSSGDLVTISWRVEMGNTCQDVQVWRGTDSLNLSEVFTYPGICGDNDSDKVYSYTDQPPLSGIFYYYRIVVITDKTIVKKVFFPPDKGLVIYPNPARASLQLAYNPSDELLEVNFYDVKGKLIYTSLAPESLSTVKVTDWPAGAIFYEAVFKNDIQTGKLVITK